MITLKLFDTYGPNDFRGKLISLLERISVTQESLAMSPGEQIVDLVYIEDVIDAFVLAAQYVRNNEYLGDYAIPSGNPVRLKEIANTFETVTGKKLNINWGERSYREREVMVPWNKGTILPGWTAKVDFASGLEKTICRRVK